MGITEQGIDGEQKLFKYLALKGFEFFQADAVALSKSGYIVLEVKKKSEPFKPPPFYGHGLDIRQVRARLKFQEKTGMRCGLLIFEPNGILYKQWVDVLNKGKYFDTKKGIRIYPLESFEKVRVGDVL